MFITLKNAWTGTRKIGQSRTIGVLLSRGRCSLLEKTRQRMSGQWSKTRPRTKKAWNFQLDNADMPTEISVDSGTHLAWRDGMGVFRLMTEEKNVLSIFQRPQCNTRHLQSKDVLKHNEKMVTQHDYPFLLFDIRLYEGVDGHSSYCYCSSNPSLSGDLITCSFASTKSMSTNASVVLKLVKC